MRQLADGRQTLTIMGEWLIKLFYNMNKAIRNILFVFVALGIVASSCERASLSDDVAKQEQIPFVISGNITQIYQTRVNDNGFADGDIIGIYVVDYNGDEPGVLETEGNRADNVWFKFSSSTGLWQPAREIYWKDKKTNVDIYGYYPFTSVENVGSLSFEVSKDQSSPARKGELSGYEASDFLWGKVENVAPTSKAVSVPFTHRLASIKVSLREGTGFATGEWNDASKSVLVTGTGREATIDLANGIATVTGIPDGSGIIPYEKDGEWRAVVVPQTISAGVPLIAITVDGLPYRFSRDEEFTFSPSKQHNFTIIVNKKPEGDFEFILSDESISAWENDSVSHDAVAREYVVVDVPKAGTLEACITASGKDVAKIRNLKVTGEINSVDFAVMKYMMNYLTALNLKDVRIVKGTGGWFQSDSDNNYKANNEDCIPSSAFEKKESLTFLVLPDRLKSIGEAAFCDCTSLSGNINFPEGLVSIEKAAFRNCKSLLTINFPTSLTRIGNELGYTSYWDGVFAHCTGLCCELVLPENIEIIGMGSFYNCPGLYGSLHLPESLKGIGEGAFGGCTGLTGSIKIPQAICTIHEGTFDNCGFNGTLALHNGITVIGANAFKNSRFKGELNLPSELEVISDECFLNCDFAGKLVLPKTIRTIGSHAFENNGRLTGLIEIPEGVISIGAGAFAKCYNIEGVIFPESLESIKQDNGSGAFEDCFGINRIVCKGEEPPYIQSRAFNGVSKDNFTVEVPENAIVRYQTATGWKDFNRISAYRNLSLVPRTSSALNSKVSRDFVLYADDEWEVEECPEWIVLSQTSGRGKTSMSLTFSQMPSGENREGKVIFKLKDSDYKVTMTLAQYDYKYAEDETLTLQSASEGIGINLVFLGDGYSAKDISEGKLLKDVNEAVDHFFNIEPYCTYRKYFNVYTGISVSAESGVGSVNTIVDNRFNTIAKDGVTLGGRNENDLREILKYACNAPTVNEENICQTLVVMIPNTSDYGGVTYMYDDGSAISYCPKSDYVYPFDFRGVIQHEAGGHGFGKLGDECIYHNAFIDACGCSCCGHTAELAAARAKGWYENLSLSAKPNEVPWSHLLEYDKYKGLVDIYEGGFMHSRGVYRSESNSCMNNDIPYYNTISRESIVRRIKAYAGEEYNFEDFMAKDIVNSISKSAAVRKFGNSIYPEIGDAHHGPVFMKKHSKFDTEN